MITATLRIPTHTGLPDHITAEVTENVEEAITSVTGLEMRVSVAEPSEEPYIRRPGVVAYTGSSTLHTLCLSHRLVKRRESPGLLIITDTSPVCRHV
jgi:hypothetical protein